MNKQEIVKKQLTPKGIEDLSTRMKSFITLFNQDRIPFKGIMLGFGEFEINDKKECLGRITELAEILGKQLKIQTSYINSRDGTVLTKEEIKCQ